MELIRENYVKLINEALDEDLTGIGDVTSDPLFSGEKGVFKLISKDTGVLCGKDVFTEVFNIIDGECSVFFNFHDGDELKKSDEAARIEGRILSILKGERTALNFISHMSGIATKTAGFVREASGMIKILDTRKTIPGMRMLQKYAVKCGGGVNHRIGLYDMVLVKDNHIDAAGGITKAVEILRSKWGSRYKIEVETRTLDEVKEALSCGVDRIMLDNMDDKMIGMAAVLIGRKCETEVSGNITIESIAALKGTGIDYVSIGELTHTVRAFDFSLKKEK